MLVNQLMQRHVCLKAAISAAQLPRVMFMSSKDNEKATSANQAKNGASSEERLFASLKATEERLHRVEDSLLVVAKSQESLMWTFAGFAFGSYIFMATVILFPWSPLIPEPKLVPEPGTLD